MNVQCLEASREPQPHTDLSAWVLMHTACHGLGRKAQSNVIGSCSARNIRRHIAPMIFDNPGGDFSASCLTCPKGKPAYK